MNFKLDVAPDVTLEDVIIEKIESASITYSTLMIKNYIDTSIEIENIDYIKVIDDMDCSNYSNVYKLILGYNVSKKEFKEVEMYCDKLSTAVSIRDQIKNALKEDRNI